MGRELTAAERTLFTHIAADIREHAEKYRGAGRWLDRYHDDDKMCWERRLIEVMRQIKRIEDGRVYWEHEDCLLPELKEELRSEEPPPLWMRLAYALEDLWLDYRMGGMLAEEDARAILIIAWVATDPDANRADLGITKFADLPWKRQRGLAKPSRLGLIHDFFFDRVAITSRTNFFEYDDESFLRLVFVAWDTLYRGTIEGLIVEKLMRKSLATEEKVLKLSGHGKVSTETKQNIAPAQEALLESIRRAYQSLERATESDVNLDGVTFNESLYAEAGVIDYLTGRFGEQDDALGNWPRDWHECPEAFELWKAKINEFRQRKAKASLEKAESIAEQLTTQGLKVEQEIKLGKEPPELNEAEQNIIEALNTSTLTGEKLSAKAGYPYNSNFKKTLSGLRKRKILDNKAPGYFLKPEYHFLLNKSD